jgi:hypothetical protein
MTLKLGERAYARDARPQWSTTHARGHQRQTAPSGTEERSSKASRSRAWGASNGSASTRGSIKAIAPRAIGAKRVSRRASSMLGQGSSEDLYHPADASHHGPRPQKASHKRHTRVTQASFGRSTAVSVSECWKGRWPVADSSGDRHLKNEKDLCETAGGVSVFAGSNPRGLAKRGRPRHRCRFCPDRPRACQLLRRSCRSRGSATRWI